MNFLKQLALIFITINLVNGHGHILDPPSRRELYRVYDKSYPNPYFAIKVPASEYPSFCGFYDRFYYNNDGKCGVCGDEYSHPKLSTPRLFEIGGAYERLLGKKYPITRTYKSGQIINITHEMVNDDGHGGYVGIKVCPLADSSKEATQECFDQYPLEIMPGPLKVDKYKVHIPGDVPVSQIINTPLYGKYYPYSFQVKLPDGLTCDHCVFQWNWINYGRNPRGTNFQYISSLLRKGSAPLFRSCADVRIISNGKNLETEPTPIVEQSVEKQERLINPDPLFIFYHWQEGPSGKFEENLTPDLNKFTGTGLNCWIVDQKYVNHPGTYEYFRTCYDNCRTIDKVCPQECKCRWYQ